MQDLARMQTEPSLLELLIQLESQMRLAGIWSSSVPSEEALASREPFACDQMSFPEWLQHIFLPKMMHILEHQQPLPESCDISPMAEHYFSQQGMLGSDNVIKTIEAIQTIDRMISVRP